MMRGGYKERWGVEGRCEWSEWGNGEVVQEGVIKRGDKEREGG